MTPPSLALGVIFVVCVDIFFILLAILTYKCCQIIEQHHAIHENLDLENQISGGDVEADHVVQQDLENQISGIVQSLDKTSRPITSETNEGRRHRITLQYRMLRRVE
ncbi:hypothetical protein V6N13_058662 [Hibiscus sabdariffa]|uniref:Uncharacterized protein n=1 Tax=Hibiscus sabdariffa TaxID=183260 RepID=A0ABR2GHA7_9ROSI